MNLSAILLLPWHWYILWAALIPALLTVIPPKPYRAYIACTILFAILIKAQFLYKIDVDTNKHVSIPLLLQGMMSGLFFYTFNLFFLVEYPEFTDYRIDTEKLSNVRALKPCTYAKFKWAVNRSLLVTLQGTGWNWGISSTNAPLKTVFNWKSFLIKYTIYDIFFHMYVSTDYIQSKGWGEGHVHDLILGHPDSKISLPMQFLLAIGSVYCIHFGIETLYNITVILNVYVFKFFKLSDYTNLFGTFNDEYTIKSLWGNVWHKMMYQLTLPQAKYLTGCDYISKHLGKSPRFGKEIWRKYTMFLLVFVFTGLYHATGTLNMPWTNGLHYNINAPFADFLPLTLRRCFYSFFFFPAQFVLIVIESVVQLLYKKCIGVQIPRYPRMIIGLAWISLAEVCLLQLYIDELVKSGFDINDLIVTHTPVHLLLEHIGQGAV